MNQDETLGALSVSGGGPNGPDRDRAPSGFSWPFGFAAGAVILAIAILSWTPGGAVPRSGAPGQLEHVAAYWVAGALAARSVPDPYRRWVGLGLILLAGILEIGQIWIPGRTAQVVDFAAGSAGALVGIAFDQAIRGSRGNGVPSASRLGHLTLVGILILGAVATPVWIGLLIWYGWAVIAGLLH